MRDGPEQDAARSPNGTDSRGVPFQGGAIVVHTTGPRAGTTFALFCSIGALYISMGGAGSWPGLPVTDEVDITGRCRTDFENGYIVWDRLTGGSIPMRDGSAAFSIEPGTNRGGSDILSFPAVDNRVEMCRDGCAGNSSFVANTYVEPGWQGERAMCWLESVVPPRGIALLLRVRREVVEPVIPAMMTAPSKGLLFHS